MLRMYTHLEPKKLTKHTPSEARTMNLSLSVRTRWENSGTDITPYSFKQKSPNARAIANPGASSNGNQTLDTSGSSCNAKTRPLQRLILSASPIKIANIFVLSVLKLYLLKQKNYLILQ